MASDFTRWREQRRRVRNGAGQAPELRAGDEGAEPPTRPNVDTLGRLASDTDRCLELAVASKLRLAGTAGPTSRERPVDAAAAVDAPARPQRLGRARPQRPPARRSPYRPWSVSTGRESSWSTWTRPASLPLRVRRRFSSQVARPILHQDAPPLEQVRAPIGGLDGVPNRVRQRRLDDFPGMIRLLFRCLASLCAVPTS